MIRSIQILGLAVLFLSGADSFSVRAATSETNAVPEQAAAPKSVFVDDPKQGKDPFYPKSVRRADRNPSVNEQVPVAVQLALKGISGAVGRRFALINNQTLAVGETASVRVINGQVRVRCLEIRENSVIVSVEGDSERKELRLRSNL
ncbi:MAG: hypothetical protein ABJC04_04995 [Verrucomicrobiota bacterium]